MPALSICIPTHDGRAEVLDRLLALLRSEVADAHTDVEVCVSDNGSQDSTQAVLARWRDQLGVPLVTYRFERNDGFTPNLLKVVEIASGDYCWLLGSDDLLAPGAVTTVLIALREHPGVAGFTLNRYRVNFFDPDNQHHDPPGELPDDPDRLHVYTSAHEAFIAVGLSQDYLSTQVVDRRLFGEVARAASAVELERSGHFAHLFLLGRMIQARPRWAWHPEALVQHTTGTSALDEALEHQYTSYQLTVMEGRDAVWAMLFGRGSSTYRGVMAKAYRRSARPLAISDLKLHGNHTHHDDVMLLRALTRYFWWLPTFWLATMPVLLAPERVLKAIRELLQRGRALRIARSA